MSQKELFFIILMLIHSTIMLIDEFYFHMKRGLLKWERIGHPLDTFSVLLCFSCMFFLSFNRSNQLLFIFMCVLSCLIIIKDESIHLKECTAKEQFLHAILFIFHPIILYITYDSWHIFYEFKNNNHHIFKLFMIFNFTSAIIFFLHQIFYWNYFNKRILFYDKTTGKQ